MAGTAAAWVAVIGVIGGAAVSGIVALLLALIQRKSLNDQAYRHQTSQLAQFRAQVAQEHSRWLLDQRCTAYTSYLTGVARLRETAGQLGECFKGPWPRRDGVRAADLDLMDSLITKFHEHHDSLTGYALMVSLAGPPEISAESRRVLDTVAAVSRSVAERAQASRRNTSPQGGRPWPEVITGMDAALDAFIDRAAGILGHIDIELPRQA